MSVCGRVAPRGSLGRQQWRGRGRRATEPAGFSQGFYEGFYEGFCGVYRVPAVGRPRRDHQLLSSDLIRLSNSSNEASPLILSPLIKKVGVESTFSTSPAYFWSAAILSSSA